MIQPSIPPLDTIAAQNAADYIQTLTKPIGSLGRLEQLAVELAAMTGNIQPDIFPAGIIVFAADHGITKEGVSAYPQEVTLQMVSNMIGGGAAINVFGRQIGAKVTVVDVGVAGEILEKEVHSKKIRPGTANFLKTAAMTRDEAVQAVETGYAEAVQAIEKGMKLFIAGEVGIGNTTASSAVLAAITGANPADIAGLGTGISSEQHLHKIEVIRQALEFHQPDPADAIDILSKVGGLEIAAMAGAMLAAAEKRIPVLLDGFISTTAACAAALIEPRAKDYFILSHQSAEQGHVAAIRHLGKEPVLNLGMRLGEGTGAAVAFPILQSAVLMTKEMATFASAGVAEKDTPAVQS